MTQVLFQTTLFEAKKKVKCIEAFLKDQIKKLLL